MSRSAIDLDQLRVALRRMSRGNLLIVAERAIEITPRAKLRQLVGDMVRLDDLVEGKRLPVAWHALWRLPPAMTWSDMGATPWMRYQAVSFVAAARPLHREGDGRA